MGRKKTIKPTPMLRRDIREGIREGLPDGAIFGDMRDKYPTIRVQTIRDTIKEQHTWQDAVDTIHRLPKRTVVDLPGVLGCTDPNGRVRIRIEIRFYDSNQERWVRFGHTADTNGQGRLQDILNDVIGRISSYAGQKGYKPTHITSSMTSGRTSYRITHAECV